MDGPHVGYIEGAKCTVRTDHDALRWLMSLTESSGRLTRWQLRLAEYDFTIQYKPGRVHQVPDALSRLVSPRATEDPRKAVEVDDDMPTFDSTTVCDMSDELRDHACTAKCDHNTDHVFVTSRNQAGRKRRTRSPDGPVGDDEALALQERDDPWAEIEEFDAVDIERAQEPGVDASGSQVCPLQDYLPSALPLEEIAEEQRVDDFCHTVLAKQSERHAR